MKALSCILLIFAVAVLTASPTLAADKGKAQTVCPMSGKPINKEVHVDQDGKRVYFCCQDCVKEFKADPAKAMAKLKDEEIMLADAPHEMHEMHKMQSVCPVSGKPIDKANFVDYKDKRVYFCCPHCPDAFKKDPEAMIKKIEAGGITLEKAPKKTKS